MKNRINHGYQHHGLEQLFKSNVIPEKLGVSCFDNKDDSNYYDDNIEIGPSNHDQVDEKMKRHRESEDDSSSEDGVITNFAYQPSNDQSDSIETNELCIEVAKILSPRKKGKSEDVFFFFSLCIFSQVRNIPERIILISTTGLR